MHINRRDKNAEKTKVGLYRSQRYWTLRGYDNQFQQNLTFYLQMGQHVQRDDVFCKQPENANTAVLKKCSKAEKVPGGRKYCLGTYSLALESLGSGIY